MFSKCQSASVFFHPSIYKLILFFSSSRSFIIFGKLKRKIFIAMCAFGLGTLFSPLYAVKFKIAVLKYGGGGDWYANPTSLGNLIKFCNKELKTNIDPEPDVVEVGN